MFKNWKNVNKRKFSILVLAAVVLITAVIWCLLNFMPYSISSTPTVIPPDTLSEHDMAIVKNQLLLLNTKGIMAYNKKGEYQWDFALKTAAPYLAVQESQVAVADCENAAVWRLNGERLSYSIEETQPVSGAVVNKNGYIGVISSEHGYRSIITVYDDYGTECYKWYSGDAYITAAAISDNNKYLAVAGIMPAAQNVQTVVYFFDMGGTEPLGQVILENEVAYKLLYSGSNVYLLTDKGIFSYNKKGSLKEEYSFVGRTLHAFSFEDADSMTVALSRTDEAGGMLAGSSVIALSTHLKEKCAADIDFEVTAMDAKDGFIAATGLRNAWLLKNNGSVKAKATLTGDCEQIRLFNKGKAFVTLAGSTVHIYSVHAGF